MRTEPTCDGLLETGAKRHTAHLLDLCGIELLVLPGIALNGLSIQLPLGEETDLESRQLVIASNNRM
jgi:hypothetical protein